MISTMEKEQEKCQVQTFSQGRSQDIKKATARSKNMAYTQNPGLIRIRENAHLYHMKNKSVNNEQC